MFLKKKIKRKRSENFNEFSSGDKLENGGIQIIILMEFWLREVELNKFWRQIPVVVTWKSEKWETHIESRRRNLWRATIGLLHKRISEFKI